MFYLAPLAVWEIALLTLGILSLVGLVIIVITVWWCYRWRQRQKASETLKMDVAAGYEEHKTIEEQGREKEQKGDEERPKYIKHVKVGSLEESPKANCRGTLA